LTRELFDYILHDETLAEEFPIVKENDEIYLNFMILHVMMVLSRLVLDASSF
jgi:hypothetical protein